MLSAPLGNRARYLTENLLGKFTAETRDSPFVLILETFCNAAACRYEPPLLLRQLFVLYTGFFPREILNFLQSLIARSFQEVYVP